MLDELRNTTTLATVGCYTVIEERQRIELRHQVGWFDLHEVTQNGHDSMFLRAVCLTPDTLVVFDLRQICPGLNEIRHHHPHDVPGLVLYTLRGMFSSVPQALAAIAAKAVAWGRPELDDGHRSIAWFRICAAPDKHPPGLTRNHPRRR